MKNIVIGIEGLVGSGKTSICRELLDKIPNSIILHGGNLYRAIIYMLMNNKNINLDNLSKSIKGLNIRELMDKLDVKIELEDRETVFYVGNIKLDEEKLQSVDNSLAVSIAGKSADNSHLYVFGKQIINMYKERFNVIVSGRDLINIYPEIDYHFFIIASLEERIKRKCIQYNESMSYDKIKENIIKRDTLQEQSGFYKIYDKTIKIDVTDCKSAEEGAEKIIEHIEGI